MPDADVVVVEHDSLLQDGNPHPRVVDLPVAVPEALQLDPARLLVHGVVLEGHGAGQGHHGTEMVVCDRER